MNVQAAEVGDGVSQELTRACLATIGTKVGEADTGVIVNSHDQELPTGPSTGSEDAPGQFAY